MLNGKTGIAKFDGCAKLKKSDVVGTVKYLSPYVQGKPRRFGYIEWEEEDDIVFNRSQLVRIRSNFKN